MFAEHVMVTVTSFSLLAPEEGDTRIHDSEDETLQSRLQVKVKDCVPPSRVKVKLRGPVIVTKGAFSQERTSMRAPISANEMVTNLFIIVWFYIPLWRRFIEMRKGVSLLYELDPVASPNAVKLRSRIRSHLSCEHSLNTRQFDSKFGDFQDLPVQSKRFISMSSRRGCSDDKAKIGKRYALTKESV